MNNLTQRKQEQSLILLVDDLPTNLHVLVSALKMDFRLKTATSGASALKLLENKLELPKLVILDVKMPGMSGIEVLSRMRNDPMLCDIPVILVSADTSEKNELDGLNLGADDYLVKPISANTLIVRVQKLIQRRHALIASNDWNRSVLDRSFNGFLLLDVQGNFLEVNETYCQMTGYTSKEIMSLHVSDVFSGYLIDEDTINFQRIIKKGDDRFESRHSRKDGSTFQVEVNIQYRNVGGGCFVVFIQDITDRKNYEAELKSRSQQLQSVFDLSPDGLVLTDENGRVVLVNPALCSMTGLKADEWLLNDSSVIWQKLAHLTAVPEQILPGTEQNFRLELERPRKRVLTCQILNVTDNIANGSGNDAKEDAGTIHLIYLRDITRDDEVDQMKSEFITTAAHELRTPLTSVLGYSELLMKDMIPQALREGAFELVIGKTKLLINIINEMLDLARIESRRGLDFNITSYLADVLVSETVATYVLPVGRDAILIESQPDLRVNVDEEKFKAVLTNLLDNAYKYSITGDVKLQIVQEEKAGVLNVGFRVQDAGIGMSPAHQRNAFERFWRADESGNVPGTGLGLSIVKEVMRVLGGSVDIESTLGFGSVFTLWLPHARVSLIKP